MQPSTDTILKDIDISLEGNALTFKRSEQNQVTIDLSDAQAAQLRGALRLLAPPGTPAAVEMTAHDAKVRIQGGVVEISKLDVKIALNFSGAGSDTAEGLKALTALPPSPEPKYNDRFAEYSFHRSSGATAIGFSDHLAARRKYSALLENGIQNLGCAPDEEKKLRASITYTHVEVAVQSFADMYNRWAQCELNVHVPKGTRLNWQEVPLDSGRDREGALRSKEARQRPVSPDLSDDGRYKMEEVMLASDVIVDLYLRAVLSAHADNFRGDKDEVVQRRALSSVLLGEFPSDGNLADLKVIKLPGSQELKSFNDSLEAELNPKSQESVLITEPSPSVQLECAENCWNRDQRNKGKTPLPPNELLKWYTKVLNESDEVKLTDSQWVSPRSARETVSGAVNLEDYFALYRRARDEQTLGSEEMQREIVARMKRSMSELTHSGIIQIFEDKLDGINDTLIRGKTVGLPTFLLVKEEERQAQTEYFLEILRKFP